ncbi:amino acid ABC transporter permease [Williamsia sp. CHRR-6]|uniref:amino acid ABC transporter permease n=1 Tax=Williamsia sp. CHRR-6 TaxID=2835871 RepID=UPI001BDB57BF|nr:amino acid ABC transporter permease [Williamsia sp. CHRR-6]MBT0567896.1 amino acid ABC transporter permease [Williamsia sp. CHRR-6]
MSSSVLYDAPGPRARRRNLILSVLVALVVAALVIMVLGALADKDQLTSEKWKPFIESTTWTTYLLPGIRGTVVAAAFSIVFALILGLVLGVARMSQRRAIRLVAGAIVELFRAIPVLILMIFTYQLYSQYQVFQPGFLAVAAVVTGLTLYNGSVIAEIVRSGVMSLPRGQSEAAVALGLRPNQVMRMILLPQAVTVMMPSIIAQMVVALKDSALGYVITYIEVVRSGQQVGSFYGNYLPALIVVAAIMIVLNSLLSLLATLLERKLRGTRSTGSRPAVEPAVPVV